MKDTWRRPVKKNPSGSRSLGALSFIHLLENRARQLPGFGAQTAKGRAGVFPVGHGRAAIFYLKQDGEAAAP